MQYKLFSRAADKSALQQGLDRDRAGNQAGTGTEDAIGQVPEAQGPEIDKPLFKRPTEPNSVFHVDLMGAWQKP
jgi:hypothetical protein